MRLYIRFKQAFVAFLLIYCATATIADAASGKPEVNLSSPPKVVVTIKPIHSLVAGIMEGVAEPDLLIEADSSAHTYQLKPSEAAKLYAAQVIIWVGPVYETALVQLIMRLKDSVQLITVSDLPEIRLLPSRILKGAQGCSCSEAHQHDTKHGGHHHEISGKDGHLWLAAPNAKIIVKGIAQKLAQLDQRNASRYLANSQKIIKQLDELHADIFYEMKDVQGAQYLAFHDFTQYFDSAYGTQCIGAVRVHPEVEATAADLHAIRQQVPKGVRTIFSEPQFDTKAVRTIAEDTMITYAQIDGLGYGLNKGPNLYFEMMRRLANDMKKALMREECKLPFGGC